MALARQIMQVYLDSGGKLIKQAEQAIAASDTQALRIAAHSLKSSSANVGAETLSALFKQLEGFAREGDLDKALPLWDAARQEYARAEIEIQHLLAQSS